MSQRTRGVGLRTAGVVGLLACVATAAYSLPPHTHPDERTITVLSGISWAGVGAIYDASKLVPYPAGTFYVIRAGLPHYAAVLEGDVVFQEAGTGPSRFDVIKAETK